MTLYELEAFNSSLQRIIERENRAGKVDDG
jgi:hypothetical protein